MERAEPERDRHMLEGAGWREWRRKCPGQKSKREQESRRELDLPSCSEDLAKAEVQEGQNAHTGVRKGGPSRSSGQHSMDEEGDDGLGEVVP